MFASAVPTAASTASSARAEPQHGGGASPSLITSTGPLDTFMGRIRRASTVAAGGGGGGTTRAAAAPPPTSSPSTSPAPAAQSLSSLPPGSPSAFSYAKLSTAYPSAINLYASPLPPAADAAAATAPSGGSATKQTGGGSSATILGLANLKVPDVALFGRLVTAGVQLQGKRLFSEGVSLFQRASNASWKLGTFLPSASSSSSPIRAMHFP